MNYLCLPILLSCLYASYLQVSYLKTKSADTYKGGFYLLLFHTDWILFEGSFYILFFYLNYGFCSGKYIII